jgi:hypothetical protein
MKRAYSDIIPDGNIPALRVCQNGCSDQFDPYRLPARQPEKISIRFPRPDADVATHPNQIITGDEYLLTPVIPNVDDGNLDGITYTPVNPRNG